MIKKIILSVIIAGILSIGSITLANMPQSSQTDLPSDGDSAEQTVKKEGRLPAEKLSLAVGETGICRAESNGRVIRERIADARDELKEKISAARDEIRSNLELELLRKRAEALGIDTTGLTVEEIREKIAEAMKEIRGKGDIAEIPERVPGKNLERVR